MATGAFKGGVVEIRLFAGELKMTGTAETVQQACQDGKLMPNAMVKNLIQLGMSSSKWKYYDKARGLEVAIKESGYLEIVHKKAGDIMLHKLTEQLFLAGWINLGFYSDVSQMSVDRWGYKPH